MQGFADGRAIRRGGGVGVVAVRLWRWDGGLAAVGWRSDRVGAAPARAGGTLDASPPSHRPRRRGFGMPPFRPYQKRIKTGLLDPPVAAEITRPQHGIARAPPPEAVASTSRVVGLNFQVQVGFRAAPDRASLALSLSFSWSVATDERGTASGTGLGQPATSETKYVDYGCRWTQNLRYRI